MDKVTTLMNRIDRIRQYLATQRSNRGTDGVGRRTGVAGTAIVMLVVIGLSTAGADARRSQQAQDPQVSAMQTRVVQKVAGINSWMTPGAAGPTTPPVIPAAVPTCEPPSRDSIGHPGEVRSRVVDGFPVPFPALAYTITTAWMDVRGGFYVTIYAGSYGSDDTQGVLIVDQSDGCSDVRSSSGVFLTPQGVGPLTMTAVNGEMVSFTDPGGGGTFNLATHEYSLAPPACMAAQLQAAACRVHSALAILPSAQFEWETR
jgi:hypothetical protein